MKHVLILVSIFFFLFSCQNHPVEVSQKTDSTKKEYLPVADLVKSEMATVDSFPLLLKKYTITGNRKDSSVITLSEFDRMAAEFLQPALDSAWFANHYTESSFLDQSSNLSSFTYSTNDTGYGLKRVDVLLNHGNFGDRLNSIYMEITSGKPDTSVVRKLTWKAGQNLRILQVSQPKNGTETSSQTIVAWNSSN